MTKVSFYKLAGDQTLALTLVCQLVQKSLATNQQVLCLVPDNRAAQQLDEMLWAFDCDSFVPHNLVGEGPVQGAIVEIGHTAPKGRRSVLINLTTNVPNFANQFLYIVDFVPTNEELKQQARERFKTCRQLGFSVDNQKVVDPNKAP